MAWPRLRLLSLLWLLWPAGPRGTETETGVLGNLSGNASADSSGRHAWRITDAPYPGRRYKCAVPVAQPHQLPAYTHRHLDCHRPRLGYDEGLCPAANALDLLATQGASGLGLAVRRKPAQLCHPDPVRQQYPPVVECDGGPSPPNSNSKPARDSYHATIVSLPTPCAGSSR
jgi:hypothetical protein